MHNERGFTHEFQSLSTNQVSSNFFRNGACSTNLLEFQSLSTNQVSSNAKSFGERHWFPDNVSIPLNKSGLIKLYVLTRILISEASSFNPSQQIRSHQTFQINRRDPSRSFSFNPSQQIRSHQTERMGRSVNAVCRKFQSLSTNQVSSNKGRNGAAYRHRLSFNPSQQIRSHQTQGAQLGAPGLTKFQSLSTNQVSSNLSQTDSTQTGIEFQSLSTNQVSSNKKHKRRQNENIYEFQSLSTNQVSSNDVRLQDAQYDKEFQSLSTNQVSSNQNFAITDN